MNHALGQLGMILKVSPGHCKDVVFQTLINLLFHNSIKLKHPYVISINTVKIQEHRINHKFNKKTVSVMKSQSFKISEIIAR